MAGEALLSVEEIKRHSSPDDCWIVVDGKVWDITEFAPEHPGGGEIIWKHAGYDATTTYSTYHSPSLLPNNLDASKLKGQVDTRTITPDWAKPPPSTTTELKLHEKPPLDTVICAQDFEEIAQRTASKKTWAFYSSASTDCVTRDANRSFFSRIWFRPRLLRAVGNISTKASILGHDSGLPIFVSPAAMAKMMHPSGEKGIARGCLDERVPQCVSTNASFPIGEIIPSVPKEKNHPFFFQLYVNKDREQSTKLLQHVRSLGVDSVFVTVDGPVQGKREADERVKADESLSTPMSGQKAKNDRRGGGIGRIMGNYIDPNFTWSDFAWLRGHWQGKIVVKGVQCWQDAKKCADLGMDGVLLSNHGGRNLDSSPPVIMTLLECQMNCPEIFGQLEVLIDGGIRRGADVLKCLCLGATAVGFGRPFLYALNYDGLRSLVSATAGFTLMAYVSVKLTGVLALCFPPVALGAFLYGRAIRNLSRRIQKNLGTLTKIAEERLGNVRTSQAFAGELQEVHRYNQQVRKIFTLGRREAFISASFFSASGFMGNMTFLAVLWVGGGMVKNGGITIGELSSFLMYTAYAGSSLFGLSGFYSELMKGVGAASRLFELQDRKAEISPTKGDRVLSARGTIDFQGVSFSYPTRPAVSIFNDLTFKIPQGNNVAIVAPSGAGKSTVASLLLRFYQPSLGTISIGGRDIGTMNPKQLRRKIGYVGQEPVLFSGTIAENIAYGRPMATRSEIVSAARQANCQFISDFPDGLETFVGSRGTQLSGGQKQRIAIARALLKNPDILILDEATSALDAESETLVNQALARMLQGNNTTISIAHRLSTIQRSDFIICIGSDGKVAQTGPYAELSQDKEGAFAKLMEWQMSGGSMPTRSLGQPSHGNLEEGEGQLTEEERMQRRLEEHDAEDRADGEEVGHGTKVRGDQETAAEATVERSKPSDK